MASGPTVGLDIGTQQIKAVELRPGKGALSVSALGIAPTPPGVMQNNIITDPQLMGQAIKRLLRESGITAKNVIGSVAGQSAVVIRIIEVPKMTDAELRETMKWEVERHVPFSPAETVMDYYPIATYDPTDTNPNMEVLLAVAQQDIINNYIDTAFAAGLDPSAIDIEPLAAGRALLDLAGGRPVVHPVPPPPGMPDTGYAGPQETVAIVNIGASNTDISIFQDGQLAFPRSLPLAGDSLTRAIGEMLGYAPDQAERVKREYGAVQVEKMAVYTGTAYGEEPTYEAPQFQEEEPSFTASSLPDDNAPLANPFDLSDQPEEPAFPGAAEAATEENIDRTQPIPQRTLNLARKPEPGDALSSIPPAGGDFGLTGAETADPALRNQVFEAIAPVLGELATELRRSLDYYRSRAQGRSVDRVLLTGGSAGLPNFAQFLQNELQVPVLVADPLAGLDVSAKNYDPNYLSAIATVFTVALGLAARDAVFDANPEPKKPRQPKSTKPAKTATGQPVNVTNPPMS